MSISIAPLECIATKNAIPAINVEPLWKKVNLRSQLNDDATSVSSHNAHEKDVKFFEKDSYLSQFLAKMHDRISESVSGGDSEIIDKLSIHWDECEGESREMNMFRDTSLSFEAFSQTQIMDELVFEVSLLKKCERMEEFLVLLSKINPQICEEILKERKEMESIVKEHNELLENQKRSEKHIKILMSQMRGLENKNFNLIKDFERLKKEVDEQIILEEDMCRYRYEKELQKSKKEMESKINLLTSKFELSTNHSISLPNSVDEMETDFMLEKDINKLIGSQARRVESAERIKQKKILPLQRTRNKAKGIADYEVIINEIVRPSTKSLQTSQFKE